VAGNSESHEARFEKYLLNEKNILSKMLFSTVSPECPYSPVVTASEQKQRFEHSKISTSVVSARCPKNIALCHQSVISPPSRHQTGKIEKTPCTGRAIDHANTSVLVDENDETEWRSVQINTVPLLEEVKRNCILSSMLDGTVGQIDR
jgi:hypothetical protein